MSRRQFLLACAALLAGCGGASSRRSAASFGTGSDGPPVTLDFWNGFTGGDGPQMLAVVQAFEKKHPNVRVRMVTSRWEDFYTKLPAAVQSGEGPDVALMHVDQIPTNAAHGTILPLDDLVRDLGLQEDDFAAPVWRAGAYRGHRYGVPLDMHPIGLFANVQVLEKAGLD